MRRCCNYSRRHGPVDRDPFASWLRIGCGAVCGLVVKGSEGAAARRVAMLGASQNTNIPSWVANRVSFFGLEMSVVASATTESGANVRKAMICFTGARVPCASHYIHTTVQYALGGWGETPTQRSARLSQSGRGQARQRKACRKTIFRQFLARCRATVCFFEHSCVEALSLLRIVVSKDPACRNLLPVVRTR